MVRCKNLAESFDDDSVQAGVGAHSLVQQRFRLNSKLDAPAQIALEPFKKRMCWCKRPEEVSGGSSGVALLRVEEEPVAMLKLLLGDVPAQLLDVDICNLIVLFSNLKIARALSSSEVQYLTSTLTRLENVWYSVLAA